jgi:hypothetical protein
MVTPAVRASTTKRARPDEVFDKMTTVRGLGSGTSKQLQLAIAEALGNSAEGRADLAEIKANLIARERALRPKSRR